MPLPADDVKRRRFIWGIALAWIPFILFFASLIMEVVRSASSNKATGLGAVAGGFPISALVFACEVIALVLLARSFSSGHPMRAVVSVLSICVGALMLFIFVGSTWLLFHPTR